MKSSSRTPELFRTLWHPAISVSVSCSTIVAIMVMVNRLAGIGGPRALTVVVVIIAALVEALVGNILYSERAGIGNRIRELVIYLILVYALASIFRSGPFFARFVPAPPHLAPTGLSAITWLYAYGMHNRLRGREELLRTFGGLHGEELRHALVERQHDMALTVRELRNLRSVIASGFTFLVVVAILTAAGVFTASTLPVLSGAFILLCLNGAIAALAIGSLNTFADEYAANGVGLSVPIRFQRRRITMALVVVAVAFAGAFILSRNSSLLPLESIAAFFRWFGGLFDRQAAPPVPEPIRQAPQGPSQAELLMEMIGEQEPRVPPLWLRMLALLLRRAALAALAVGVVVMIFGPIFSPAFRAGLRNIRPGRLLRNFASRLLRQTKIVMRLFRTWLRHGLRRRGAATESGPDATEGDGSRPVWIDWSPSLLKRRQMGRVVAVFASIAKWGSTHGLGYRQSEGADEYLKRIAQLYPEVFRESQVCASTFWEARYSRHMLPLRRMREYVSAARRITRAG